MSDKQPMEKREAAAADLLTSIMLMLLGLFGVVLGVGSLIGSLTSSPPKDLWERVLPLGVVAGGLLLVGRSAKCFTRARAKSERDSA